VPPVPSGYPYELSDEDLALEVQRLLATAQNWPDTILPELQLQLVHAGIVEQARRETKELRDLTRRVAEQTGKQARLALIVAVAALAVAIASLAASSLGHRSGSEASSVCGAVSGEAKFVRCTGDAAPGASFGTCTPAARVDGLMLWECHKP
jgi:hypothetical protein